MHIRIVIFARPGFQVHLFDSDYGFRRNVVRYTAHSHFQRGMVGQDRQKSGLGKFASFQCSGPRFVLPYSGVAVLALGGRRNPC